MIDDDSLELDHSIFQTHFIMGIIFNIFNCFNVFHCFIVWPTHSALLSQGPTVLHSTDVLIQAGLVVTALGRPETDEALQLILGSSWRLGANLAHGSSKKRIVVERKMDGYTNDIQWCLYVYIYIMIYQPWFTWPFRWDEPPRLPITPDPSSLGTVFPDADLS